MIDIVADIGGTNARIGLARGGRVDPASVRRYRNADFPDFGALIAAHVAAAGGQRVRALVVAIAGPVTGRVARLTNLDWALDADRLAADLGGAEVRLVNDLRALGHALPVLAEGDLAPLVAGPVRARGNGQSLIVGIGTGFNVSLVIAPDIVAEAEYGHVGLSAAIAARLGALGVDPAAFPTVEELFSGRGLAAFARRASGRDFASAEAAPYGAPAPVLAAYLGLVAELARDLVLAFMPLSGVHFAGGAMRGLVATGLGDAFAQGFARPHPIVEGLARVPVSIITADAAALAGGARLLRAPVAG
ncbi:MAG: glucokinase [Gemmobacter sp.]